MPTAASPPTRLAAGDTIDFAWSSADYPAPTWSGTWRIIGAATGLPLALTSATSGSGFRITATAAATAGIAVPARGLSATLIGFVSAGAERFEIYRAGIQLLPNAATITGDLRGHAAIVLAAIEAVIENRATKDQMGYRIGDRSLERTPLPDLLKLRDQYRFEAAREADAAALASGMPRRTPRALLTRMARA